MMTRRWSGVAKEKYSRVELYSVGRDCERLSARDSPLDSTKRQAVRYSITSGVYSWCHLAAGIKVGSRVPTDVLVCRVASVEERRSSLAV